MKYLCETCNYETNIKICFQKHIESKKHMQKVSEKTKVSQSSKKCIPKGTYVCPYCKIKFTKACNLARHKKTCGAKIELEDSHEIEINSFKDKIINLEMIHKTETDKLNAKIIHLEQLYEKDVNHYRTLIEKDRIAYDVLLEENRYLKTLINNAGNIIKTSVSTVSYVAKNYKDAPAIGPLDDYAKLTFNRVPDENDDKENEDEDEDAEQNSEEYLLEYSSEEEDEETVKSKFVELLTYKYENDTLDKYLGNIIIKSYKKDDPAQQSIWNSDTSRLTYVIHELFNNQKIDWTVDKKGVKTKSYIIEPLLKHIDVLLRRYVELGTQVNKDDLRVIDYMPKMERMNVALQITLEIENGNLSDDIIRYIAPHFYLRNNKKN